MRIYSIDSRTFLQRESFAFFPADVGNLPRARIFTHTCTGKCPAHIILLINAHCAIYNRPCPIANALTLTHSLALGYIFPPSDPADRI